MQPAGRDLMRQFVWLGIAMVPPALIFYWVDSAFFAPGRMPACVQEKLPEGRVCPDTLLAMRDSVIIWIDARSESDFEVRHMELPENNMFPIRPGELMQDQMDTAMSRLTEIGPNDAVVVFCSGGCSTAEEVAAALRETGVIEAPVYVLEGGWDAIKDNKNLVP